MSESQEITVTVFGGSSGGAAKEGIREFRKEWLEKGQNWSLMDEEKVEDLDMMWLAASLGEVLAKHRWNLITGGYDMGTMGMVNRSAKIFKKRYDGDSKLKGFPLVDDFGVIPHVDAQITEVKSLGQRMDHFAEADAFVILKGAHGTLSELTHIIEEEDIRDEGRREGKLNLAPRPIVVADSTGKTGKMLKDIFGVHIKRFLKEPGENVVDRIHILSEEAFVINRDDPLKATVKLSETGEQQLVSVLENKRSDAVKTLRELLQS